MPRVIDYTLFDSPDLMARMFYPRRVWSPPPPGAQDHMVPIEKDVSLSARFYMRDRQSPTILFFHGNGEVVCDYDDIAPDYLKAGANLFAVDFRGYGKSSGTPLFSNMISDARAVFPHVRDMLKKEGYTGKLYVKGRSLGGHSALEAAYHYHDDLAGMIHESSGAGITMRMTQRFEGTKDMARAVELQKQHEEKVRSIRLRLLVIHGEIDELVPVESAIHLYDAVGSKDKRLEVIPGAGHNDLLWIGHDQYFRAVREFVGGT